MYLDFAGRIPKVTNATLANLAGPDIRCNGGVTLGALAQEYPASTVTIGGGVTGTAGSDASVLAPGVVISGGTVVNSTGIGVDSGGGSSIGTTTGGDDSAAIVE